MQLTQYSDYALRTLIYLAVTEQNATITDIAESYDISRNHLVKVVHGLGKLGYINTTRGRQGGLHLAHDPKDIKIGEVVRKTEPNFHLAECFDGKNDHCVISPACKLKGVLGTAFKAFLDILDQYTLADVIQNKTELQTFLQIQINTPDPAPKH